MRLRPAVEGFPYGTAASACYLCANAPQVEAGHTFILDTEQDIIGEGWLMICEACVDVIVGLIGYTSPTETKRQLGRIRNLEDEVLRLERERADFENRLLHVVTG
jgi:hypothetical protein